jgi:hypothetical protein
VPGRDITSILIRGKGNKRRRCPVRVPTAGELADLV